MCGIIHVRRFDSLPARKIVTKLYKKQENRGKEGYGFVALGDGAVVSYKKSEGETAILEDLNTLSATEIMFHHRKPSSTINVWEASHPIRVSHDTLQYNYYVVHNGHITEPKDYKVTHDALGFKYQTLLKQMWLTPLGNSKQVDEKWNDSETFAIELARDLDKRKEGLAKMTGNIAFVCLQTEKETGKAVRLFWGRNRGSPLKFNQFSNFFAITSEAKSDDIIADTLFEFNYAGNEISSSHYDLGIVPYNATRDYSGSYYTGRVWDSTLRDWVIPDEPKKIESPKDNKANPEATLQEVEDILTVESQLAEVTEQLSDETLEGEDREFLKSHAKVLEKKIDEYKDKYEKK